MSLSKDMRPIVQCPECNWSHSVNANGTLPEGTYKSPCLNCTHTIKFKSISDPKSQVSLSINGKSYVVPNTLDGKTTLNAFIRDYAGLRGTKNMCFAGGCGSCVVTVSHYDRSAQKKVTYAINSCLCPVFACDGYEITTTEGLGSKQTGFNPIQTKLADNNGSQCGWCSPGMVMNMHGLLSENPRPTQQQIEDAFSGQICRCTGYRNILDAMRSFASDAPESNPIDIEDLQIRKINCTDACRTVGNCSKNQNAEQAIVQTQDAQWYQPTSLDQTLGLMKQLKGKNYGLLFGSTGNGIYHDEYYDIYISLRHIEELYTSNLDTHPVKIGANVTLAQFVSMLERLSKTGGYEYCAGLADHVLKVANVPVRNAGSIAGNLMIRKKHLDFPSDIFVILETIGASLMIADANTGMIQEYSLTNFISQSMAEKVITSIMMPKMTSNDFIHTYKVMPGSQNTHAYVSGGFRMNIDSSSEFRVVNEPSIVYSGINDTFIHATKTESYLQGKNLSSQSTVQGALEILKTEVNPINKPLLASPEYRRNIALALFYRYVLQVLGSHVPEVLRSGASEILRGLSSGTASYGTQKEMWPVSKPMPKISAKLQASGEAVYVMDIPPQEGELRAAFVVTTEGNAKIESIDASAALKMPGVVKFIKATDIPGNNSFVPNVQGYQPEEILCKDQVLYAGQAVGLIVAETEGIANTAAGAVKITYSDVKPPILSLQDAIRKKSFFPKPAKDVVVGDAETAIGQSPVIIEGEVQLETQYHMSMETHACLAVPKEEALEVYTTTQWPDQCQQAISQCLNINNSDIHVSVGRLGGAYGCKISRNSQIAAACALASSVVSRPVRLHLYLSTNMQMIGKRFPYLATYQVGVTEEGKLNGIKITYYCDCGSSPNECPVGVVYMFADNVYSCENWHLSGYAVRTNSPSHTWCRAPGSLEAVYITETIMEHVAYRLGKDPANIKKLNLYKKGQVTPVGQPLLYCNISSLMEQLLDSAFYKVRKDCIDMFNKENRWKKRGLSVVPMKYGVGYDGTYYNAYVTIYNGDGTVVVTHGGIECGQGINTKVIQVAAYELGIPMSLVRVRPTETVTNSNSASTGGSTTSELCCQAIIDCCKELNARIHPVRSAMKDPSWKELIQKCFSEGIDLTARYWDVPKTKNPFQYNTYGVTCSEVELDVLTGERNITRVDILYDCGNSINPEIDVGQVHGAFVMGIGYCLTEKTKYDPTTGQNLTDSTWEYRVPMSKDIPEIINVTLLKDAPNPLGVLGSKAVGEPPQTMSCSVLFALKHAIEAARREKGHVDHFPLTTPATVEDAELHCLNNISQFVIQ